MQENDANSDTEKFLFQLNDFSGEAILRAQAEAAEPPPPSYTQDELEAAKKAAYEEGRRQGQQDSDASKIQSIQNAVQNLAKKTENLLQNEDNRRVLFENEAVHLSFTVFKRLFPHYFDKNGLEELKNAISQTLEAHNEQNPIHIYCNSGELSDLQMHLKEQGMSERVLLEARNDVQAGDCEISWGDGGATHKIHAVSDEITAILTAALDEAGIAHEEIPVEEETADENCAIIEEQEPDITDNDAPSDGDTA